MSIAYTTTNPSSKIGEFETTTLLMVIGGELEVTVRCLDWEREGIEERERREAGEMERGERCSRRRESGGCPAEMKAESGGAKMVRVLGRVWAISWRESDMEM